VEKLWVPPSISHPPTASGPTMDAAVLHLPLISPLPLYQVLTGLLVALG